MINTVDPGGGQSTVLTWGGSMINSVNPGQINNQQCQPRADQQSTLLILEGQINSQCRED